MSAETRPVCVDLLKEVNPEIDEDTAKTIVAKMSKFMDSRLKEGMPQESVLDAARAFGGKLAEREDLSIRLNYQNKLLSLVKANELWAILEPRASAFGDRPYEALESLVAGSNKVAGGSVRDSGDARRLALGKATMRGLYIDLSGLKTDKGETLLELFADPKTHVGIANEIYALAKDKSSNVSGDKDLNLIAQTIVKHFAEATSRYNRAGGMIERLDEYVGRQAHDRDGVRKLGLEKWMALAKDTFDEERIMADVVGTYDEFLKDAFENIQTGAFNQGDLYPNRKVLLDEDVFGFKNNLSSRLAQPRMIHFKDGESMLRYGDAVGNRPFINQVYTGLKRLGERTALLELYGPNPQGMIRSLADRLIDKYKGSLDKAVLKEVTRLNGSRIATLQSFVDGSASIPDDPTLGKVTFLTKTFQNMAHLPNVLFASLTDVPVTMSALRYQGDGLINSLVKPFVERFNVLPSETKKTVALHTTLEGLIDAADMQARVDTPTHGSGTVEKLESLFFDLTGLTRWTNKGRQIHSMLSSSGFGDVAGQIFDRLPQEKARILKSYGIGPLEWEVIRHGTVDSPELNATFITSDAIKALDDATFKAYGNVTGSYKTTRQLRDDLVLKWQTLVSDQSDYAVLTPSAKELALANLYTQSGTPGGTLVRLMNNWLSYGISMWTKPISRDLYANGAINLRQALMPELFFGNTKQGDVGRIAGTIAGSTLFGAFGYVASELVKGHSVPDFTQPYHVVQAITRGGGFGIYGDYLLGGLASNGADSIVKRLAGPTFSTINDLYDAMLTGDHKAGKVVRLLLNSTPFINLFYARRVLDYLILNRLIEFTDPGYFYRQQNAMYKFRKQTLYIDPYASTPVGGF